jgi:hypothetical protein
VGTLPSEFKLVEIDPLLAFQAHIELPRVDALCGPLAGRTDLPSLLAICLPTDPPIDIRPGAGFDYTVEPGSTAQKGSATFVSDNMNVRVLAGGPVGSDDARRLFVGGVAFGEATRFIQVVRFGGRFFLRNGYHRAYGLRRAGVTHMPAIVIEGNNYSDTGAQQGGTFDRKLLESDHPPVCGHYTQGRAIEVTLRASRRVITAAWTERFRLD